MPGSTVRLLLLAAALCLAEAAECTVPEECGMQNVGEEERSCNIPGRTVFGCRSGDCIDLSLLCDGETNCRDGSDESDETCKNRHVRATAEPCMLPQQPANGQYALGGCNPPTCEPQVGAFVDFALLNYTCYPGFRLSGPSVVICNQNWTSPFPTCVPNVATKCEPLNESTRVITCRFGNDQVNCNQPMEPLTKATLRCKVFYEQVLSDSQENELRCNKNGQWSGELVPCTPRCGEYNGEGKIPWYAAVLTRHGDRWSFACSASIVSQRAVISAAHCQWDEIKQSVREPSEFRVVVGKYEQGPGEEQTNITQVREVERIVVPEKFNGRQRNYEGDISIIILKNEIIVNELIRPICLDREDQYSPHFIPGKIGVVGSWGGPTNQTYKQDIVSLPLVDFAECTKNIPEAFIPFLTYDKFCAGSIGTRSVCAGDSGVGFANQFRDGKWYLSGVLSVGVSPHDGSACDVKFYKGFTRFSLHRDFINRVLDVNLLPISKDDKKNGSNVPQGELNNNTLCRLNEFQCNSNECVNKLHVCDGREHCSDGSDETYGECRQRRCPEAAFQCKYGACIDRKFLCNGENDCADGSDEENTVCSAGSSSCWHVTSKGCTLPKQPTNGRYTFVGCAEEYEPGTIVSVGVVLNYTCNPGFALSGPSLLACYNGWSSEFPFCNPVSCPPLKNPSREIECILNGEDVDCETRSVPIGTRASVKCKIHYESIPGLQSYDMICEENGKWTRGLQSCIPKCGVANTRGVPFIGHGHEALLAELPWHIGLYQALDNGTVIPSCGGSIVSSRVVISAAHCFWHNGELSFHKYKIVAGKYHYAWENKTKYVQHLQIQDVILPKKYKGPGRNYENDIAVIILRYDIQINEAVRPVCVDYDQTYLRYFSPVDTVGNVTGWGLNENQTFSGVLNIANLRYVDVEECERNTPREFHALLTNDKFCAGNANTRTTVCPGDSGGGYAVRFRDGRSYLVGVVSNGPSEICALYPYAAFTNVFHHINFIREYVYKYV